MFIGNQSDKTNHTTEYNCKDTKGEEEPGLLHLPQFKKS